MQQIHFTSPTWKGGGIFAPPVYITPTHIRPLTNRDPGNSFPAPFGRPRPIKHWRRGTQPLPVSRIETDLNPTDANAYNMYRVARTSVNASLGGGGGGFGAMSQVNAPGNMHTRTVEGNDETNCTHCAGRYGVSGWYPTTSRAEIPDPTIQPSPLPANYALLVPCPWQCYSAERSARRRVRAPISVVSPSYFQRNQERRYNHCQTFQQRQFNFITVRTGAGADPTANPGSAEAVLNQYVAQCPPHPHAHPILGDADAFDTPSTCGRVYYKPNNPQYAQQGAVTSSTRIMTLRQKALYPTK